MRRHIEGTNDLEPIVKWPGGKEKELQHIVDNAPMHFETFYEPFNHQWRTYGGRL